MIHVFFRTCEKVETIHIFKRPFGLKKKEIIKMCFKSLCASLEGHDYKITIVADDISKELEDWFIMQMHSDTVPKIINEKFGNDASIRKTFELAKEVKPNDIVYFVEDDYLHLKPTISAMTYVMKDDLDILVHPTDYPDRYTRKEEISQSYLVFLNKYCHWRQIRNITFTFMCRGKFVQNNFDYLIESSKGARDGFLSNLITERYLCFSPIPGLATHMHEGTMSPFIDWQKVMEVYK